MRMRFFFVQEWEASPLATAVLGAHPTQSVLAWIDGNVFAQCQRQALVRDESSGEQWGGIFVKAVRQLEEAFVWDGDEVVKFVEEGGLGCLDCGLQQRQ